MIDEESLKSLEKLHQLKRDGILTEEEFESAKSKVLQGQPTRSRMRSAGTAAPNRDDFLAWIILPIRRYADFKGRSGRKEFWLFQLIYLAIAVVTFTAMAIDNDPFDGFGSIATLTMLLALVACLGLFIPLLAVEARRFHDQNLSGLFVLLNLIPYLGPLMVYIFMALPGTSGDNRFGPAPDRE